VILCRDLKEASSGLTSRAEYNLKTKKMMQWKQQAHATERSVSSGCYENSTKKAMKEKWAAQKTVVPSLPKKAFCSTNRGSLQPSLYFMIDYLMLTSNRFPSNQK
jgi:hypothetical protein